MIPLLQKCSNFVHLSIYPIDELHSEGNRKTIRRGRGSSVCMTTIARTTLHQRTLETTTALCILLVIQSFLLQWAELIATIFKPGNWNSIPLFSNTKVEKRWKRKRHITSVTPPHPLPSFIPPLVYLWSKVFYRIRAFFFSFFCHSIASAQDSKLGEVGREHSRRVMV